jgi:hypothetical protein
LRVSVESSRVGVGQPANCAIIDSRSVVFFPRSFLVSTSRGVAAPP